MKYIVWLKCAFDDEGRKIAKEDRIWEEQGDGPLTRKQADRIAAEINHDFSCRVCVLPVGSEPVLS